MTSVLGPLNLAHAQYNSPEKKQACNLPQEDESDDTFSFKLNQVQQNCSADV